MSEPRHAASTRSATFGELLAQREFGALFAASAISWVGDYLARAAVTALVFTTTRSVVLSAAAFAVGYLPGLTCGPLLAAMAERYANRTVLIVCDLGRAVLIALVAIPGLPTPALLGLLFATTLLNPPFDASRSSLLPRILTGDQYVAGVSLQTTTNNIAQVCGYFAGGAMAPFHPHMAIVLDSLTFLASAALVWYGIRPRDPIVVRGAARKCLLRETAAGFRLVVGNPVLRAIAALVLGSWLFAVVPEGPGRGLGRRLGHTASAAGVDQALIMVSAPIGTVVGAIMVGRVLAPERRRALIRPLALLIPIALIPALADPPVAGVAIMSGITGFAVGGLVPPANGLFVQALPGAFRARAFGVMQFGLQLVQAAGIFATSAIAERLDVPRAVGVWSLGGAVLLLAVGVLWPSANQVDNAIAAARAENAAADPGRHASRPSPYPHRTAPRQPLPSSRSTARAVGPTTEGATAPTLEG